MFIKYYSFNLVALLTVMTSSLNLGTSLIHDSVKNETCFAQSTTNICFGHDLKESYFLLADEFCNLNHGSFGTIPKLVADRQYQLLLEQGIYFVSSYHCRFKNFML